MAWKMIYLARRNPALAAEQFAQAWREHSSLGAGCTNVRDKVLSVTQCSRVLDGEPLPGTATDYDGVNLLALRDLQAATDIWNDPETLAIMRPDEPRVFSTYVRHFSLVCEAQVLREVPRGSVCLVGFLRRREALDAADWRSGLQSPGAAGLVAGGFAAAGRVVHNRVHLAPPPGYEYDSICEWWFDSAEATRQALGTLDVRRHLAAPIAALTDLERSVFMFTRVTHSRP
ncbi:MAG: EthD domain-containing protein [Ideonella sp.]|nr:EthD domain-containing protein [Ideonella sp.]